MRFAVKPILINAMDPFVVVEYMYIYVLSANTILASSRIFFPECGGIVSLVIIIPLSIEKEFRKTLGRSWHISQQHYASWGIKLLNCYRHLISFAINCLPKQEDCSISWNIPRARRHQTFELVPSLTSHRCRSERLPRGSTTIPFSLDEMVIVVVGDSSSTP